MMGESYRDFPRVLVVETSLDGQAWEAAWDGDVIAPTIEGSLAEPLLAPATIPFSPRRARYVRLRQTGRTTRSCGPCPSWRSSPAGDDQLDESLLRPGGISPYIRQAMLPARRSDPARALALDAVLDRLTGGLAGQDSADNPDGWVTAVRRLPAAPAAVRRFPRRSTTRLRDVLRDRGIEQLYTHQAAAIDHALAGRHVVITTPTASGKTLCYNAPVLSAILRDPSARALYLFPTKALAQDQLAELHELSDRLSRRDRARDRRVHLRRRHAAGRAARHPRPRARGAQQPRHDPLGHPAAPSALGEAVREPALRRDRRAARVSRRVRQPPHERAAAAAAHLPALRVEPDVHLLVGHDRQPARAGRGAGRAAVRAGVGERRAARREVLPVRQPAGRQPAARHPPLVSGRNAPHRGGVPEAASCS